MCGVAALRILLALVTTLITEAYATQHYTLSQIQPIDGFSSSCTVAYNTPLTACSADSFQQGGTCSISCVSQLQTLQNIIIKACAGTKALPDDLIGRFFTNTGVDYLCGESAPSGSSNQGSYSSAEAPIAASSTESPAAYSTSTSETQRSTFTATKSTAAVSTTPTVAASGVATTTKVPVINSSATFVASALGTQATNAVVAGSSGGPSATAASVTHHRGGGGGGGTPFDISSDSTRTSAYFAVVFSFLLLTLSILL